MGKFIKKNQLYIMLILTVLGVVGTFVMPILAGSGDGTQTSQSLTAGHDANAIGHDQNNYNGVPQGVHDETVRKLGAAQEKIRELEEEKQKLKKQLEESLHNTKNDNDQIKILKGAALKAVEDGDYAQAEKLLNQAIAANQNSIVQLTAHIGDLHFLQSDFAGAATYYSQAASMTDGAQRADYLNVQGKALYNLGDCNKAEPVLNESLSIREKTFGTENAQVAESLNDLAVCDRAQGKEDSANERLKRAAEILKELSVKEHAPTDGNK